MSKPFKRFTKEQVLKAKLKGLQKTNKELKVLCDIIAESSSNHAKDAYFTTVIYERKLADIKREAKLFGLALEKSRASGELKWWFAEDFYERFFVPGSVGACKVKQHKAKDEKLRQVDRVLQEREYPKRGKR